MTDHWFESDDIRLFAVARGSGPVLVMLHGGMADHHAVLPLVRDLPDRFKAVTPDLRAAGKSHWTGTLSFDRLTRDLEQLLDSLGVESAIIGGVSSGSGVALHFALHRPDRIAALALLKPIYAGTAIGYTAEQRASFAMMNEYATRAAEQGIDALRPLFAPLPDGVRERALEMVAQFDPASVASTTAFLSSGVQPFDDARELARLRMPVLLHRGDDAMHPASTSDLYAANIAGCEILDSAVDTAHAIQGFVERHAPS